MQYPIKIIQPILRIERVGERETPKQITAFSDADFFKQLYDKFVQPTSPSSFAEFEVPAHLVDRFYRWVRDTHGQARYDQIVGFNRIRSGK